MATKNSGGGTAESQHHFGCELGVGHAADTISSETGYIAHLKLLGRDLSVPRSEVLIAWSTEEPYGPS